MHPYDDKTRPHLCTVCDKRFMTKSNLNDHIKIHTAGKLYSCSQCEKQFKILEAFEATFECSQR